MGYAISWLAVRGKPAEAVVSALGLTPTGTKAEYGEAMFTGRALSNGWFLLVINECEHKFTRPESLSSLSNGCDVIGCTVEEHVMVCTAEAWKDGAQIWRLEHDAHKSIEHLSKSGSLPSGYATIESSLSNEQEKAGGKNADTDYFFDIPLQTAKSIVGFKHDEDSGLEEQSFEVFRGPEQKPWWKFW